VVSIVVVVLVKLQYFHCLFDSAFEVLRGWIQGFKCETGVALLKCRLILAIFKKSRGLVQELGGCRVFPPGRLSRVLVCGGRERN
jgi:hypothetical protein